MAQQSLGSFHLSSSLVKIKAGNERFAAIASHQFRKGNGFRPNSAFDSNQSYARLDIKSGTQNRFVLELTRSEVLSKQGGGLSEAQFLSNPSYSSRARNYFQADWLMPVIKYQFQANPRLQGEIQVLGIFSGRSQIGFTKANEIADLPLGDGAFALRQLDTDRYTSFGIEGRMAYRDSLAGRPIFLSSGFRLFDGRMERGQLGTANGTSDFTLTPIQDFTRKLSFENQNLAFYVENLWKINSRFAWTFGLRTEFIRSFASQNLMPGLLTTRSRQFVLVGSGLSYHLTSSIQAYGNYSQSFRPVSFSDLVPSATTDQVDPNLKDARAQNVDLGVKGQLGAFLRFDLSYFLLSYQDRIGQLSQKNAQNQSYLYRTNVGESTSHGLEAYLEWDPVGAVVGRKSSWGHPSFFISTSLLQAQYDDFPLANGQNLRGKQVEYAPKNIIRAGISYQVASFSMTYQISHTSSVFSDAQNSTTAIASGLIGPIPGYQVHDMSFSYRWNKHLYMKSSVNNLLNASYFTRRGTGAYPGFGILPAELRNISFTFGYTW
jgi:Fe(3+) dicitrate transport protein